MTDFTAMKNEFMRQLSQAKEKEIIEQLGSLIERKILVLCQAPATCRINVETCEVTYIQKFHLECREEEYIQKLEKENSELKQRIEKAIELLQDLDVIVDNIETSKENE